MDYRQVRLKESPSIAVVGMATVDYLYMLDSYPHEESVNAARRHGVVVGGPAGRSAIAAARLGGRIRVLAMCGTGVHAEVLRRELALEPLEATFFEIDQPSQHSCVIVAADNGTRTTIWTAQPRADQRMLNALDGVCRGAAVALLDCTDPVLSKSAIESCRRLGVPVVIDTGSYREWSEAFLAGVDYIVAPEKFFRVRQPDDDLEKIMRKAFDDFHPKVLAATRGELGGVYLDDSGMHSYDPFRVAVVDSCGAGDTFHGAFAWAIAADAPVDLAFRIASWVAARKCSALGNDSLPDTSALARFVAGDR